MSNSAKIILVVLIIALVAVVVLFSRTDNGPEGPNGEVACTMEARICPDGSTVGRIPPSCEFAACPVVNIPSDWETSTNDEGVTFQYPPELDTEYISVVDWPPAVQLTDAPYECIEAGEPGDRAGETEERTIGNRTYCVTTITEGAAGSIFHQYAFATLKDTVVPILIFSLREVQCGNFGEPQASECEAEQAAFDIGPIVDQVMTTLEISES